MPDPAGNPTDAEIRQLLWDRLAAGAAKPSKPEDLLIIRAPGADGTPNAGPPIGYRDQSTGQYFSIPQSTTETPKPLVTSPAQTSWVVDPANAAQEIGGHFENGQFVQHQVNGQPQVRVAGGAKPVTASAQLDRLDAMGRVIAPDDKTTPVAKLRDPITGTVTDMPDPKTSPNGEYREVGGSLYLLKAGEEPKLVIANPDKTKTTTFQGPNGAQYEYDPSKPPGQRTTLLVAGEKKPDIMTGEPSWRRIPGTNQQQAYRIVDGQPQDIPGLTKNVAQKLIAPQDQETWTVVDEDGQVISTYKNPGYKAPPPQVVTGLSTDTPYLTTRDTTTGAISSQIYPGYQAKTQADVAAQVGRLQTAAQQKRDELKSRIGQAGYTAQNAARDFDQWWNQNVEPQKQGLAAAQQQAQLEEQRKVDQERRTAYTSAAAIGQQAAQTYQAGARNRVGPEFGNVINQLVNAWASGGKLPQNLDVAGAVTYQGPTADQIAEQATAKALAFISPTAAQIAGGGQPGLQNMMPQLDINQLLQASTYSPGNFGAAPVVPTVPTVLSTYRQPQQIDLTNPFPARGPLYG